MADKIIDHFYRLKIDFFSLYVALGRSVNCSNSVYPSSTGFEQLINFVSSNQISSSSPPLYFTQFHTTSNSSSSVDKIFIIYCQLSAFLRRNFKSDLHFLFVNGSFWLLGRKFNLDERTQPAYFILFRKNLKASMGTRQSRFCFA